jgi:hypothetical protein
VTTPPALTVQQRLTLAKWLLESIGNQRKDDLVPASRDEMPSGSRVAAMFGGKVAAWVVMPKPKQPGAYVSDPVKLLAWVRENFPHQVVPVTEVVESPELIEHLRKHFPSALKVTDTVETYLVSDICTGLKDRGHFYDGDEEKVSDIPGITLPEAEPPVPTVTLTDDAEAVIGEAWRGGAIPVSELLALPGGGEPDAT